MTSDFREPEPMVRMLNPVEHPNWDASLAGCPGASFFHGSDWLRVLRDTYGYSPLCFILGESGRFRSALPVMEVDSWLTGRRGIALPFTDECGPLGIEATDCLKLFSAAIAHGRQRGWRYLECRGRRSIFGDVPASTSYYGHRLDLAGGEARLFAGTEASAQRAVRKAEKSNLAVTVACDTESVRAFYALLCKTRRRHGLPAQPFSFFANIQRQVLAKNKGVVILARDGATPVAGAVFLHFEKTAIYKFGASDERMQHLRANNLVMWAAIKLHANQGFGHLDFGRTSLGNLGLRKFKLGWGATERTLDYVRYDLRTGAFVTVPDESSGWYNRVFKRLPISLSRLAGAALYRHVA